MRTSMSVQRITDLGRIASDAPSGCALWRDVCSAGRRREDRYHRGTGADQTRVQHTPWTVPRRLKTRDAGTPYGVIFGVDHRVHRGTCPPYFLKWWDVGDVICLQCLDSFSVCVSRHKNALHCILFSNSVLSCELAAQWTYLVHFLSRITPLACSVISTDIAVLHMTNTIRYDILFALKNWQASCQFNLAHELKEN